MKNKQSNSLAITSLLTAVSASLCCITPVLALLAGSSGIAASFSWLDPFRPWLIGITVVVLAFAWYQKLKPRSAQEIECECEDDEKPSFWHSKKFLGIVTVFAVVLLAFPYYADAFYPETNLSVLEYTNLESTYEINITGMTCSGCEEHVKLEIGKLSGISGLEVSYEKANAVVTFDESKTNIDEVKAAVDNTGYKVESINKQK
ncbi:MAG: heavy metal transporter [Rickettsiales bacterium]|nr:heavy metal transporter [Rickettsiales bacterium]|tara:strand:+ start:64 stop:675 length:612 start_codon:yes stop_codon:yes gene_type:complete